MRIPLLPLLLSFAVAACAAQAVPTAPAYESNPEFVKTRLKAKDEARRSSDVLFALDDWRKANKIAGGKCMECMTAIFNLNMKMGEYKHAIDAAHDMETAADDDAGRTLGRVYTGQGTIAANVDNKKPNMAQLQAAHDGLVKAEAMTPAAYFYDGRILSMMHHDSEAGAAFAAYAQKGRKSDPLILRAQHMALHPELGRAKMVPAVVVTTLDGKRFNLDEMTGKVVLIDFWATWCGPCLKELPHIKKLAAQYAGEPFEIISVSWDNTDKEWKDFVAANGMTWNQYRDANHSLSTAFGINAIPHYFTIDSNGVLTAENLGSESNIDGRIKTLVKQAKDDRERLAAAPSLSAPGLQ